MKSKSQTPPNRLEAASDWSLSSARCWVWMLKRLSFHPDHPTTAPPNRSPEKWFWSIWDRWLYLNGFKLRYRVRFVRAFGQTLRQDWSGRVTESHLNDLEYEAIFLWNLLKSTPYHDRSHHFPFLVFIALELKTSPIFECIEYLSLSLCPMIRRWSSQKDEENIGGRINSEGWISMANKVSASSYRFEDPFSMR